MSNFCIIIPCRYNSSRFPGKVFTPILGKPMIQRVWEKCIKAINKEDVYVATSDFPIINYCENNGIQSILTKKAKTGTDRIADASEQLKNKYDMIINVQGDEPIIKPEDILKVSSSDFSSDKISYCGMCKIKTKEDFKNPNIVKVVTDSDNRLLYASRAPIPTTKQEQFVFGYKQVCIYAFSPFILSIFKNLKVGKLEEVEDIEILRLLENGYEVKMVEVSDSSISVDVYDDVKRVENEIRRTGDVV